MGDPSRDHCEYPDSMHLGLDYESSMDEDPICVVSMACRLPGDISSPSDLWDFLLEKKSAHGRTPSERFKVEGFYDESGDKTGTMNVDGGYYIQEDVRLFENNFFGINNLEATYMDPQQRKLLEVTFECFESAGLSMESVSGRNIGVYVASFTHDYFLMQMRDPDSLHRYHGTGSGTTLLANRISHVFNLHGPSFTLDTACSSSIHCLHAAVSALRNDECDAAVVAATNLILTPEPFVAAMKTGVLSSSSICQTFDAAADGYGRAEGVNVVYLKRLSAALRDGDGVCAVIRGTAINSNGRTPGVTLPSSDFQEAVIRKAYAAAGLNFSDTDYIECHGTGTAVGDPIEIEALGRCFAPETRAHPLMIGSIKANLGHSEAASGISSLIKVALAFQHGAIPPMRSPEKLNPKLRFGDRGMKIVGEVEQWPRSELRRASLNSFGYGGANAHAILESAESFMKSRTATPLTPNSAGITTLSKNPPGNETIIILPISAQSIGSLGKRGEQVTQLVRRSSSNTVKQLTFTLAHHRPHLSLRASLIAQGVGNDAEVADIESVGNAEHIRNALPLAFVFTGQGSQYPGMAQDLLQTSPVFLAAIREQDEVLKTLPGHLSPTWTLEQSILDGLDISRVHDAVRSQPLCTAVQVALVQVLRSWGVKPSCVVGHSSGEIAAAFAAELLSLPEAILVAYFRGFAVNRIEAQGGMLATGLTLESANGLIEEMNLSQEVYVACINAPESVTLSGSLVGLDQISEEIQLRNKFCRALQTGGRAYHSPMIRSAGIFYEELLREFIPQSREHRVSSVAMYSTVGLESENAMKVDGDTDWAIYWRRNLDSPVHFSKALNTMSSTQMLHFVEIGPHSALKGPIRQTLASKPQPYSPSLVRNVSADLSIKRLAGILYSHGHDLHWANVNLLAPNDQRRNFEIPPYPWDYSNGLQWFESRASIDMRSREYPHHELLGSLQLAGNGIEWKWRNLLRLDSVPWIRDHQVEDQIIFPAAAYLAVAVEAVSQILGIKNLPKRHCSSFMFQNVTFSAAMVLSDGQGGADTELHTTMSKRKLSNRAASSNFFDFSISSWKAKQAILHCAGIIRVFQDESKIQGTVTVDDDVNYRTWPMDRWYRKAKEEGLCFGPDLQSIVTLRADSNRLCSDSICQTHTIPSNVGSSAEGYPIHPITMDACLQAAILSAAAGRLNSFRPYLPVFIQSCHISPVAVEVPMKPEAMIHVKSQKTGVSSLRSDSTLRDAAGHTKIDMKGVRLSMFSGKLDKRGNARTDLLAQRNPVMRVRWKPDVIHLNASTEEQLDQYVRRFATDAADESLEHNALADQQATLAVGALLDLVGHKNPRMNLLCIGEEEEMENNAKYWLLVLDHETPFARCRSLSIRPSTVLSKKFPDGENHQDAPDVVVHMGASSEDDWHNLDNEILSLFGPNTMIITRNTTAAWTKLGGMGLDLVSVQGILLAKPMTASPSFMNRRVSILTRQPSPAVSQLAIALTQRLLSLGASEVSTNAFSQLNTATIQPETLCISLLETEQQMLASLDAESMDKLRAITGTVRDLLWVTGAAMLSKSPDVDLTLAPGLARSLMMEQPFLRFLILDVGRIGGCDWNIESTCNNIQRILHAPYDIDDKEYIQFDSLLHVSRLGPDFSVNYQFRRRLGMENSVETAALGNVQPVKVSIGQHGVADTIFFEQVKEPSSEPPSGYIDVAVAAVSLNAKDVYAIHGIIETRTGTKSLEYTGSVTAVAHDVDRFKPGDRVLVCLPNDFSTKQRVPAWQAHLILPHEDPKEMSTLLVTNVAALYALRDRANLRSGETVLVHSGAGAFGIAVIKMAQHMGATVYATVGSPSRRDYLKCHLGIPLTHIFSSRDESFVDGVMSSTGGRGVDVVINSLIGDLMHASWRCVAEFGRFIEAGKRELLDAGNLQMDVFSRNASFMAFDITEMLYHHDHYYRNLYSSLSKEVLAMYRSRIIQPVPIRSFDAADIVQAYRYFSSRERIGKVVITFDNPQSLIPVSRAKHLSVFDSNKSYLLVGCLGGLGRSLSNWMRTRGARNFVFLGRSGCDKPQAAELVAGLRQSGSRVTVVRGDVANMDDVTNVVAACAVLGPIGGVVHAAMGLHEDLFDRMSEEGWQTSVRPKWAGAWNLHNALENAQQDPAFFLLTSSMTGTVGVATESNYCAANAFLDAFAYWRRTQGKSGISVGLGMVSEVGYLHENPKIESLLLRRGIQPLDEDEFLQVVDLAIGGGCSNGEREPITATASHMLTGMETFGVRKLMSEGFEVTHTVMDDQRSAILSAALEAGENGSHLNPGVSPLNSKGVQWLENVQKHCTSALMTESGAASLREAIESMIAKKFSNLILMPLDKVDLNKSFAEFGVDSMIASEFRTWFWNTFQVDVPFLDLLSSEKDLGTVAARIESSLLNTHE